MAYRLNSAKDSRGDEHIFMEKFGKNLQKILAYQQQRGGDLEGAYAAVMGEPWPEGRSVKLKNGTPEMTKDRTFKSVMGKYVAPIGAGALTALTLGGAAPTLAGLFGGGSGAVTSTGSSLIGGLGSTATASGTGLGLTGVGSGVITPGLIGATGTGAGLVPTAASLTADALPHFTDAATVVGGGGGFAGNLAKGAGAGVGAGAGLGLMKKLAGLGNNPLTGAGLDALGGTLSALFGRPLFQERSPFTGSAAPQKQMEDWRAGMDSVRSQLEGRPPLDFGNIRAQNPMGGMADDQEPDDIKRILSGLR